MTHYENNLEHILEELNRIDLIVHQHIEKWRAKHQEKGLDFQGLYISEGEVDTILQTPPFGSKVDVISDADARKIEAVEEEIRKKKFESLKQGKELRLHILSELFQLEPFEVDVLLICLAQELDLRYEKLYSYLQNDVTKKRPTVDLAIRLLCSSFEERLMSREYFSQSSPLVKNGLVHLISNVQGDQLPLLSKHIKIDERITDFLLGSDDIDQRIRSFSRLIEPGRSFKDIILADDTKGMLMKLLGPGVPMMLYLYGPYGTGKKTVAGAVCMEMGTPVLVVDSKVLMKGEPPETLNLILREARLQGSPVYLDGFDAAWKEQGTNAVNPVQELDCFPGWVFLSGEQPWEASDILKNHGFLSIAFPRPAFAFRKRLWESLLDGNTCIDVDIEALASKFKFSGGQIRDAIFTAHNVAAAKGSSVVSMEDLNYGCRVQSSRGLSAFSRKIEPNYGWEDIVLPEDAKEQLREVSGYIKHRGTVYNDWGFDRKLSLGKGLNILFSGPSGTGKTMAAEIIAKDAGLDLYKIDLSSVVSKYIGETEKNLNNIFREAWASNAILFFDEADALFGKRSEVRDSHDRYANIEISYLLQKMEEYDGVTILATNLYRNMDDAFVRRMQVIVEFPFPDEEYRRHIWAVVFPGEAPIGDDIDLDMLAREIRLPGGNIKNIALAAAFYAAGDGGVIRMQHLLHAARREHHKLGQTWDSYNREVIEHDP